MAMTVNILAKCVVRDEPDNQDKWPGIFACRPMVGDIVCAESGRELAIVAIKHAAVTEDRDGENWQVPKLTLVLA